MVETEADMKVKAKIRAGSINYPGLDPFYVNK